MNSGGYLEMIDLDFEWTSPDGSLTPEHASLIFNKEFIKATRAAGMEPSPGPRLEGWMKRSGFSNVHVEKFVWPVGTWPSDQHLVRMAERIVRNVT